MHNRLALASLCVLLTAGSAYAQPTNTTDNAKQPERMGILKEKWDSMTPEEKKAAMKESMERREGRRDEYHGVMKDKWEKMTPEEREAAKKEFRERREKHKEARKEKWEKMTPEEKEKAKAYRKERQEIRRELRKERGDKELHKVHRRPSRIEHEAGKNP